MERSYWIIQKKYKHILESGIRVLLAIRILELKTSLHLELNLFWKYQASKVR